ncbi:MAG: hypothetical protein ACKOTH_10015, partial [Solirubrobacterales bacterium]
QGREYILKVGQEGRDNVDPTGIIAKVDPYIILYHGQAYEVTFFVAGGLALVGAVVCFFLVQSRRPGSAEHVEGRRWRWRFMGPRTGDSTTGTVEPTASVTLLPAGFLRLSGRVNGAQSKPSRLAPSIFFQRSNWGCEQDFQSSEVTCAPALAGATQAARSRPQRIGRSLRFGVAIDTG